MPIPSPPVESSADALSIAIKNNDQPMIDLLASYGVGERRASSRLLR